MYYKALLLYLQIFLRFHNWYNSTLYQLREQMKHIVHCLLCLDIGFIKKSCQKDHHGIVTIMKNIQLESAYWKYNKMSNYIDFITNYEKSEAMPIFCEDLVSPVTSISVQQLYTPPYNFYTPILSHDFHKWNVPSAGRTTRMVMPKSWHVSRCVFLAFANHARRLTRPPVQLLIHCACGLAVSPTVHQGMWVDSESRWWERWGVAEVEFFSAWGGEKIKEQWKK